MRNTHASTPARQHASTPARQHASTPARQHASTPARQHAGGTFNTGAKVFSGRAKTGAVRECRDGKTHVKPMLNLAQIQYSAKSEIFVFPVTSDKFSRSHVI
ncbi:hypothetical protein HM81_08560 [Salmonella enterica subsp. enterica]|nr:hypothetical protein [Salmonella enterica]EBG8814324.1 hypothetical protein [Salmonella enterica]ECH8811354.1 hypothetical protein [Salmonella enterica subsp. enterica]